MPRPAPIGRDTHGKRALFSGENPPDPGGAGIVVRCSRCGQTTTVGPRAALRLLAPSLHLPFPRARHPSLLRCPACRRISWVRLGLRLPGRAAGAGQTRTPAAGAGRSAPPPSSGS
ncbi:MAG: hypothetical protein IRZ08_16915 [Frankia sp.]|nr:hypothetical protein [Frankia sp.]